MKKLLIVMPALLAVAGCGGTSEPVANNVQEPVLNTVTGQDDSNTVEAMSDGTLRLTLARALSAADLPCDGVVKAEKIADMQGQPTWRATCKNGKPYAISVSPDGTANIVARTD